MQPAYFDNAATTPLCDAAKSAMTQALEMYGNPSSLHSLGIRSAEKLEAARKTVADTLKVTKQEIYFTSGGTEADNIAVIGAATALRRRGNKIVTTAVEHAAVLESMQYLQKQGFEVVYIKPDKFGRISPRQFENEIDKNTILVSCMQVNNENGAIMPTDQLKAIIERAESPALLHVDAVQAYGKYPLTPSRDSIDLMTVSSHKIHGPKGAGALYVKKGVRIVSPLYGGAQEGGIRPGTEPLPAILGFAAAASEIRDLKEREERACEIKTYLQQELSKLPDVEINSAEDSSAYVLNFSVLGIRSETMLHFLEAREVYVSSGSACAKGAPSHVLQAMGLSRRQADSAIRVSLSHYNTIEDAKRLIDGICDASKTLIRAK